MEKPASTPFKQMNAKQKTIYILRIAACILSFGFLFPNAMNE